MICGSIGAPADDDALQLSAESGGDVGEHLVAHINARFEKSERKRHCGAHLLLDALFADLFPDFLVNGFKEQRNEHKSRRLELLEVSRGVSQTSLI